MRGLTAYLTLWGDTASSSPYAKIGPLMTYQQQPYQPPVVSGAQAGMPTPTPEWKPPKSRALPWLIAALALALIVAAALAALLAGVRLPGTSDNNGGPVGKVVDAVANQGPTLAQAEASCRVPGRSGLTLRDNGKTLIIDTQGEEDLGGVAVGTLVCVMEYLQAPAAVTEHMDSTRALDGRQTDSWGSFTAGWTYHPDAGVDMVIQQR